MNSTPVNRENSTAIRFDLPYGETVDLTVYTIFGQKVATLVQGSRAAGYHQVFWDGRGRGRSRASQRRVPVQLAGRRPARNAENAVAVLRLPAAKRPHLCVKYIIPCKIERH